MSYLHPVTTELRSKVYKMLYEASLKDEHNELCTPLCCITVQKMLCRCSRRILRGSSLSRHKSTMQVDIHGFCDLARRWLCVFLCLNQSQSISLTPIALSKKLSSWTCLLGRLFKHKSELARVLICRQRRGC